MNTIKLKVTQFKSKNGRLEKHKNCLLGLGIKRMNNPVIINNTPENRGLMSKIHYMLKVEELKDVS